MIRLVLAAWLALCGVANAQLSGGVGGFPGPGTAHTAGGTPFSISYVGTNNSASALTTYTFSAQSIGAANSTRILVVGAAAGPNNNSVTGITIDGNAMTCPAGAIQTSIIGAVSGLCYLAWPTGTTANIVVTFAAGQSRCIIEIYQVLGSTTTFSVGDGNASSGTVTTLTKSVSIPSGGGAIGLLSAHSGSQTFTGTNLTLDGSPVTVSASTTQTGVNTSSSGATSLGGSWGSSVDAVLSILAFAP